MAIEAAQKAGAMMLFGEKYGDEVRVLDIGTSRELCGGTHVQRTGDIGLFTIVAEGGVAAGVRRVEALTGDNALAYVQGMESALGGVAGTLKVLQARGAGARQRAARPGARPGEGARRAEGQAGLDAGRRIAGPAVDVGGLKVLAAMLQGADAKALRETLDQLKDKLKSAAIVLATVEGGKVQLAAGVTADRIGTIKAGELVNFVAQQVGGKGGGKAGHGDGRRHRSVEAVRGTGFGARLGGRARLRVQRLSPVACIAPGPSAAARRLAAARAQPQRAAADAGSGAARRLRKASQWSSCGVTTAARHSSATQVDLGFAKDHHADVGRCDAGILLQMQRHAAVARRMLRAGEQQHLSSPAAPRARPWPPPRPSRGRGRSGCAPCPAPATPAAACSGRCAPPRRWTRGQCRRRGRRALRRPSPRGCRCAAGCRPIPARRRAPRSSPPRHRRPRASHSSARRRAPRRRWHRAAAQRCYAAARPFPAPPPPGAPRPRAAAPRRPPGAADRAGRVARRRSAAAGARPPQAMQRRPAPSPRRRLQ